MILWEKKKRKNTRQIHFLGYCTEHMVVPVNLLFRKIKMLIISKSKLQLIYF